MKEGKSYMGKQELIIETLAFIQEKEKELLNKSGKSLGWIVDEGFTDETRAFIELMNSLYAIYDDLKAEIDAEEKERLERSLLKGYEKVERVINANADEISKFSDKLREIMKNYKPLMTIDIPKVDYSKFIN